MAWRKTTFRKLFQELRGEAQNEQMFESLVKNTIVKLNKKDYDSYSLERADNLRTYMMGSLDTPIWVYDEGKARRKLRKVM